MGFGAEDRLAVLDNPAKLRREGDHFGYAGLDHILRFTALGHPCGGPDLSDHTALQRIVRAGPEFGEAPCLRAIAVVVKARA